MTASPICMRRFTAPTREGVTPFSMFMLRNTQRAAKRGYAVSASAASLEVGFDNRASAQTVVFRWGGDDSAREMDVIERDGEKISVPRYGDGRGDDCLEGEVATPMSMLLRLLPCSSPSQLLHRRWKLCRLCLNRSPPPSIASANSSTPGFAIASSPIRSPPVCAAARRSSLGRLGRKSRTARRERGSIAPVTPNGVLSGKRRRGRRWGLRADPFSEAKSRHVCAVPTLPLWLGPYAPPPLIAHLYAPYAPPPRVAPAHPRR